MERGPDGIIHISSPDMQQLQSAVMAAVTQTGSLLRFFGEEQVKVWRRSYSTPPPELTPGDERFPGHDRRYTSLAKEDLPLTESLKETVARFVPYWEGTIARIPGFDE